MRKAFPVSTAVKLREPECIQWSPLQDNCGKNRCRAHIRGKVLGSELRPIQGKSCLSFKVEVGDRAERVRLY
jgi:hypothetical protein